MLYCHLHVRHYKELKHSQATALFHGETLLVIPATDTKDVASATTSNSSWQNIMKRFLQKRVMSCSTSKGHCGRQRLDQEPLNSSPSESPETSLAIRLSKSGYLEAAHYTDLQNSICATWIYLLFKQDTASCRHLSPPASACPSLGSKC